MVEDEYMAVFVALKEALRPFRRELPVPTAEETESLRAAAIAARKLIDKERLRTRTEAFAHGALRRGAHYLEERDVENLKRAEELLHLA
ncbi:MAG: hypothetical protein JWM27_3096 [Gemmatimonadetes bacterium]|nr:hypothetical protein [Gemmatimonadota bacterium]